jgi:hypothetical protein
VRPLLDAARARITALDPWGVNSALLGDYGAIIAALGGPYLDARAAARAGDAGPLQALRADLDRRGRKIAAWLAEAHASEEE